MLPHDEILRALMTRHAKGNRFNWATVPVRCKEYEEEIARGEFIDDKVSKEQKDFANEAKAGFTNIFECARPRFQEILRRGGAASLGCSELVNALKVDGGAFWSIAVGLYRKATEVTLDEGTARHFVDDCPPCRALLMALCLAQHQRCIAPPASKKAKRRLPNAFDLYMSLYLSYCDVFVTADPGQQVALRDVASFAQLTTEIQGYSEFCARLLSPLANG